MTDPRYLLDTNVCIDVLADAGGEPARRLGTCEPGSVVASAITYAEVLLGLARGGPQDLARAERLFELVPVLPFDTEAAAAYSRLPFRRGSFDRLIAAHAQALGLTLVTGNTRDFRDVPTLVLEDWTRP